MSAWNSSAHTGRIFIKFGISVLLENPLRKFVVLLKSDKYNQYFTWRPIDFFLSYLAQFFLEWEMFQTKIIEKIKTHVLCSVTFFSEDRAVYKMYW